MGYELAGQIVFWVAVAVLMYAIFADSIRQRFCKHRRCPKCWYDLSHTRGLTCSECGYTATRESKLNKGRRRWRYAWLAMFLFVGAHALRVTPAIEQRGWPAAVPTTAILVSLPWLRPDLQQMPRHTYNIAQQLDERRQKRRVLPNDVRRPTAARVRDSAFLDLLYRVDKDELTEWQTWLCSVVCDFQNASSSENEHGWAGLNHKIVGTVRWDDGESLRWIREHPRPRCIDLSIETRDCWPIGVPIYANVGARANGPLCYGQQARARPAIDSMEGFIESRNPRVIACGFGLPNYVLWRPMSKYLGVVDYPASTVNYEVTYEGRVHSSPCHAIRFVHLETTSETFPFTVNGTAEDYLTPIDDEAVSDTLARQLSPAISFQFVDGSLINYQVRLGRTTPITRETWPDETVLAMSAEIVHGEQCVHATTEFWISLDSWNQILGQLRFQFEQSPSCSHTGVLDSSEDLRLRLTGDPAIALRDFDATHYWAGEIILPLEVALDEVRAQSHH